METLDLPEIDITDTEPKLNLLLEKDPVGDWRRWRVSGAGSAAFHVVVLIGLLTFQGEPYRPLPPEQVLVPHVTPLYTPPDLTQKAPNKAPLAKELTVESIAPRPMLKSPAPAPAAQKAPPAKAVVAPPAPQIVAQAPPPPPKPVVMEAPKIEAPASQQTAQLPKAGQLPPQPQETQKLALQDVNPAPRAGNGKPTGLIQMPTPGIQEAVRNLSRSGSAPGTMSVGELDDAGSGAGLNLPPSAGRPRSALELKSDPMGVDFRPYMLQVIAAIRRNWFAVYPEAARLGQRGQVVLQFAVVKQGLVTKVVFNGQSGAKALDQSAVAAISASNPLPPLPTEFKGDRIVLQMTFLYNMPR